MITPKEKAKELLRKYKFKFIAKLYCSFIIFLIGGVFLKKVKTEIEKL